MTQSSEILICGEFVSKTRERERERERESYFIITEFNKLVELYAPEVQESKPEFTTNKSAIHSADMEATAAKFITIKIITHLNDIFIFVEVCNRNGFSSC